MFNRVKYLGFFAVALLFILAFFVMNLVFISAAYNGDVYFTVPDTVYQTNERISLKGYVYQANLSSVNSNSSAPISNVAVNLTIRNANSSTHISNYTFTTDALGAFYSKSDYYTTSTEVLAPSSAGTYYIKAEYKDPENVTRYSQVEISVVNQTLDSLSISAGKAKYYGGETIKVKAEAVRMIGDKKLHISNVTINGSLRNSSKAILSSFSCVTGSNGKCTADVVIPSLVGDYILELNNFKAFSTFTVIPFAFNIYMKDELGKSLKNVYALGEQGRVEVKILNASSSDSYSFSGHIETASGNVIRVINSTILNDTNSFTNSFLFTVDAIAFTYGAYSAHITVTKAGGSSIVSMASFQVKDWTMTFGKTSSASGFEYEYSTFPGKLLKFEAVPSYRANGSVIGGINYTAFTINLKDNLNNAIKSANATWNSSCGNTGCYAFSMIAPSNIGAYTLSVALTYGGATHTESKTINVINGAAAGQSTDVDGNIKDLFGTNEYVYISLTSYNLTSSSFNLSDAEVFTVSYMNGSNIEYAQANYSQVNSSNSINEWGWNETTQRLKLDAPKYGGVYDVFIFGNNRTLGATAKFILNPYDVCSAAKDTPGTVTTGYYYVWQFKTSDTIYFELKITQANNPLGKASVSNLTSGNSSGGMGSQCNVDTTTKQVVSNATISIMDVTNVESGSPQNINLSASTCQASDTSGGYSCTVKPLNKWEGGQSIVRFNIKSQDGTTSIAYSRFEARAFYLYGYSSVYQNNPSSNITLSLNIYEAGSGWWDSANKKGLEGTVSIKKIEYQGRDGEWLWPPVDSGYNSSNVNTSSITSSAWNNQIIVPVANMPDGAWKTGYYRVILQATTSKGDTDYGYAWFGVKLWDVYGQPMECNNNSCSYKSYFNSKENITLYIKVSKAGNYNYYDAGNENIGGNISVSVKKIQDCRTWPCKELNSTQYNASRIIVNQSSPWYWNANSGNQSKYMLQINSTTGTWGTGYYSVTLDVNGTDTGNAWFNTIAFYVESTPTNSNGSAYKSNIRGNSPMYFNVTSTKSYKWWSGYYNGSGSYIYTRYNDSDYVNATVDNAVLRMWDQTTNRQKEYVYLTDFNITPKQVNGTKTINVTYLNGSWPSGYYSGELTMINSEGETSTGWLWFNVQPFRVQTNNVGTYEKDTDSCLNMTLDIYDPDWYSSTPLISNYSIASIYETIWGNNGMPTTTIYNNFTNISFNASGNIQVCPNNGQWTSGSWGGYHYLQILVKDNILNDTQLGWLSFKTVPFAVSWTNWGYAGSKANNEAIGVVVNVSKPSTGAATTANISRVYQWRYENSRSYLEEYVFRVGNCYSNISGQCTVTGSQNVTIYPPANGWRIGYNYLYFDWVKDTNAALVYQDYNGVRFDGQEAYNGYFANADIYGNYKYDFNNNENVTIKLYVRNAAYNSAGTVSVRSVEYALQSGGCSDEWCRTYTSATFSPKVTSDGSVILKLQYPASNWTKGVYAIKATVNGSAGVSTITGGMMRIKDSTRLSLNMTLPVHNATYSQLVIFNSSTNRNAKCSIYLANYNYMASWYCGGWNSTNSTNSSSSNVSLNAICNTTMNNYNGSVYYSEYLSNDYRSISTDNRSSWSNGAFVITGGTTHRYTINTTNMTNQDYMFQSWCYDEDYNSASANIVIKINKTGGA